VRGQDQQFFDTFMLVVGILIGVAVGLFFLARMIAIDTQGQYVLSDPTVRAEIEKRIEPVGQVILMGSDELAAASAAAVETPTPVAAPLTGPQVFNASCFACHTPPGVGGAPPLGDAAAWEPRIAQGRALLNEHALTGFNLMPPKGGAVQLSDEEIIGAVDYMLEQLDN
jgi:cytochrome c5